MELLPQLLVVFGVFALLGFTLWWLKRTGAAQFRSGFALRTFMPKTRSHVNVLQRVDGLQLSPTHSLSLIRMADRAILIGTSPAGFHLVESSSWKTLQSQMEQPKP